MAMANLRNAYTKFEPDATAEFQYFRVFRAKGNLASEEKLMFAVLNDAVDCLSKHRHKTSRRSRVLFQETCNWIMSDESEAVFSFENICETLGIDPSYFRHGVSRWLGEAPGELRCCRVRRAPLRYQNRVLNCQVAS